MGLDKRKLLRRAFFQNSLATWLLIALFLRLLLSASDLRLPFPDAWYQTVEFGNYLAFGFMSHHFEFYGHLRNLTWPSLLSLPLLLGQWMDPSQSFWKVYLTKLFVGTLDLASLWAVWRLLRHYCQPSDARLSIYLGIFVSTWFLLDHATVPSLEHISGLSTLVALGFATTRSQRGAILAGAFATLTGVARYPSAFLGIGIVAALFWTRPRERLPRLIGSFFGLAIGGIADAIIYGRPYESLWMYTQYNVLSGVGAARFGEQGAVVYLEYFYKAFSDALLPAGILALGLCLYSLGRHIRRLEPWSLGVALYFIAHLFPSHKEGRFMLPLLPFILLGAMFGFESIRERFGQVMQSRTRLRLLVYALAALTIIANTAKSVEVLIGETFKARMHFFQLLADYEDHHCAIVSQHNPRSSWWPFDNSTETPHPVLGVFKSSNQSVVWLDHSPTCNDSQWILSDQAFDSSCLKFGRFFKCRQPANSQTAHVSSKDIAAFSHLPPFGVSGSELLDFVWQEQGLEQRLLHDSDLKFDDRGRVRNVKFWLDLSPTQSP